jgi:hypothetical protein
MIVINYLQLLDILVINNFMSRTVSIVGRLLLLLKNLLTTYIIIVLY